MNKKLLAVAVAGALAAPAVAFAQSSVTLYGIADVAYVNKNHKSAGGATVSHTQGIGEGLNAGNRVGFRGSEDLGGGLSAQFVIENGINLTNGALFSTRAAAAGQQYDGLSPGAGNHPAGAYSTGTNRQAFVGLKGGWGEVLAGYQYTVLYRMTTLNGYAVGSEQPGQDVSHGLIDNAFYGGTRANGFTYNSPVFGGGFQLTVQRGGSGGREDASFAAAGPDGRHQNNSHRWAFMPTYNSGPLSVAFGYTKLKNDASLVIANATVCPLNVLGSCAAQTTGTTAASLVGSDLSASVWQLGASYRMGGWKFVGTYADGKKNDNAAGGINTKSRAYQGGVEYTAGAWRPFLTLGTAESKNRTASTDINDLRLSQFGLRYDLSKRTTLYAMHGTTKDKVTAAAVAKREFTGFGMMMSF